MTELLDGARPASFTIRSRRAPKDHAGSRRTRFNLDHVEGEPAIAVVPPRPAGDLDSASIDEVVDAVLKLVGDTSGVEVGKRRRGLKAVLGLLAKQPGQTWQERWEAADLQSGSSIISVMQPATVQKRTEYSKGLEGLLVARVVRPSLEALRVNTFRTLADVFFKTQKHSGLEHFTRQLTELGVRPRAVLDAKIDLMSVMLTQDLGFADITPAALVYYSQECFTKGLVTASRARNRESRLAGVVAWDALFNMGHFPADTPPMLRMKLSRGQLSSRDLVERYELKNEAVKELLVAYLERREADTDFGSRQMLAKSLASHFWKSIEQIAPEQADLRLPAHVYDQWRATINLRADGKPRLDVVAILLPVRALYLDLTSWALDEPERWAHWVAPCPIPQTDLKGFAQRRRRQKERMDERTRQRQPMLPKLVDHVDRHLAFAQELLSEATKVALGGAFTLAGTPYVRTDTETDRRNRSMGHDTVRVINQSTSEVIDARLFEEAAFWAWAYVEVLRHTGIRVEELVELSHTSIRQYHRPNGEVIMMLVIAPSKSDRERVVPMSPELFHVLAMVIKRQAAGLPRIPAIPRYDTTERQWSLPLPFLFQRQRFNQRRVVSTTTVVDTLRGACEQLGGYDPSFRGLRFTPHDFRRLFATDVVNNGLPIHIGAALLGHMNLDTTRGYVAVFDEEVVRHYQDFLARRRSQRPAEEYRPASETEWTEFQEHFEKRQLELGSCGRPYGTPCVHEHACIRCSMLQVNPKMLGRLLEIENDLQLRRERALAEHWMGEVDGIDLTLRYLAEKRAEAERFAMRQAVSLGMPQLRTG